MHQLIDKKNKIIIYLLFLFILSTTSSKFLENKKSYSTTINQINVEGLSNTDNLKIYNELNKLFYKNILLVEKEEIQSIIAKYNIIEKYNIKKIYPSTININIKPTKFVARLSNNDQLLVGANGKIITDKKNSEILPYLFGEFNSEDFLVFQKNIIQSKFTFKEFKTLYFFSSNRWDILINNDILIKLPQDNLLESLNRAYKIISSDDFKNKNLVDLRVNNHLIVK
tara:strand:+ start:40 stop:717 length:678 start_codon:yes stop_codon:yes gene_type:complete